FSPFERPTKKRNRQRADSVINNAGSMTNPAWPELRIRLTNDLERCRASRSVGLEKKRVASGFEIQNIELHRRIPRIAAPVGHDLSQASDSIEQLERNVS